MTYYEKYMKRCIQLANNGLGATYPNPMVGSVVVFEDSILGEGWHQKAGKPHAEVNAIDSVKNKNLLSKSTIFVSLEPCSHFGKTPPCADLIIKHGIPKVVIGTTDPFAKVCGNGIKKLKEAGCEVIVGVLEDECQELNKRFFTFHQKKRPYIFLKWAETSNKFIAPEQKKEVNPHWITNLFSRQYTHKIRSEEEAILVGTNTVLHDNPKLDTRHWQGKNPLRVIIDRELKTPKKFSVWDESTDTIFITEKRENAKFKNTFFENICFSENIAEQICRILYKKGIQSLIVEGGRNVLQQFIDAKLWDEAFVFIGKSTFKNGIKAPALKDASLQKTMLFGEDHLFIYKNSQQ
ncbi:MULTISPECIES: bifunctional diaminohydroxyphosphoribosylaminopyrimidine deaminase/5-amino-6-(5-phosphoribosylamino)uracil reductase RibD [Capnocytophaga]|uniref:Riboflavin biosynthesis protein RibD n=1 Tax=Capnocytophaga canis TaxID=1848903 RepID=A0A0B7IN25_9FLAO|nr:MULTISPECIES: bifunctional diaminohydroxyphosphoribosylaminopyrimidine deaminase/5-amino-6-(5-phosphoribosylamino)uracil reductase RibD [Capnocytophaga]ATA73805.1 bifunctional diaminohydroxyphosphoribosylaminopyrimidine deaminase/5-amino-6-(5-phosphoribosylamino)uracil reductase [Capnocytophaga sp. H4358]GIM60120.1 riboflavin biosynthesis protein RibD [Capnocytophaga canis]CEN53276.1 Riboflavin biosynthesis protein RibD [Capnocytophaga canis]